MTWTTRPPVTRHTCNDGRGPVFGRRTPGCARCTELSVGMPSVKWDTSRRDSDAQLVREIRAHDCKASRCGPVCTFGEW